MQATNFKLMFGSIFVNEQKALKQDSRALRHDLFREDVVDSNGNTVRTVWITGSDRSPVNTLGDKYVAAIEEDEADGATSDPGPKTEEAIQAFLDHENGMTFDLEA